MADMVRRHRGWTVRRPLIPNKNIRRKNNGPPKRAVSVA